MRKWRKLRRRLLGDRCFYQECYFEPRDAWIGLFFKRDSPYAGVTDSRVYICLVPMLPIVLGVVTYDEEAVLAP